MRRANRVLPLLLLAAVIMLIAGVAAVPYISRATKNSDPKNSGTDVSIHYYNNDVNADDIEDNNFNFGPDVYKEANDAITKKECASVLEYVIGKEPGTGDFFHRISVDPALCAAIALDLDIRNISKEPILAEEAKLPVDQRADAAHKRFIKNQGEWRKAQQSIRETLLQTDGTNVEIVEISSYTSSMYMKQNGLDGDKPAVIVLSTSHAGGHFVRFTTKDGKVAKYRLECGYQPVDIPDWPPSGPDTPPDKPKPQPKDPNGGPQAKTDPDDPGAEDFWEPEPDPDPNTEETDDPENHRDEMWDGQTPIEPPTTEVQPDPKDEASDGTKSGSKTVDETNGTTEAAKDNPDWKGEVTAGDGKNHGDFAEQNDKKPNKVEPIQPVQQVNQGDLDPANIE